MLRTECPHSHVTMTYKRPITIQVISRYVPLANRAGHFTYLLEVMRYLSQSGYQLELNVLNPWFHPEDIPQYIQEIADVFIMPSSFLQATPNTSESRLKALFRTCYHRLPPALLHLLRHWWYHLRGQTVPGIHKPTAMATKTEMAFITNCLTRCQPDVLVVNETFLGNILTICKDAHRVLKTIIAFDLHYQRSERFRQAQLHRNHSEWDWEKEVKQLTCADVIVSIQQEDAETLKQMAPHAEVVCAPMSAEYQAHSINEQRAGRCLFIASDIEPNVNGLRWFLTQVWAHIISVMPQATLHVCGTVCSKIDNVFPHVQLLGRVEKLGEEYAAAQVCLIPLVVGSGLKIKLVEALSHGRACVSTSVGVQGIRDVVNRAVLIGDSAEDFAEAVITILTNSEKRREMEEQARKYVVENLSPEKVYQPFVDRIYQHIQQNNNL